MENKKKKSTVVVIIIIVSLLLVGIGGYFVYDKFFEDKEEVVNKPKDNEKNEKVLLIDSANCNTEGRPSLYVSIKSGNLLFEEGNDTYEIKTNNAKEVISSHYDSCLSGVIYYISDDNYLFGMFFYEDLASTKSQEFLKISEEKITQFLGYVYLEDKDENHMKVVLTSGEQKIIPDLRVLKNKNNKPVDNIYYDKGDKEYIDFSSCSFNGKNNTCIAARTVKGQKVTIKYVMKYSDDDNGKNEHYLSINDKKIDFEPHFYSGLYGEIYVIDDLIMFAVHYTDIRSTTVFFYDFKGNEIKKVYQLNNSKENMVITSAVSTRDQFYVEGKKIYFYGSTLSHGPSIVINDKMVELCQESNDKKKLTGNELVTAKYVIEYLGNKKFSEIKVVPGTEVKLSEYLKTNKCN